MKRDHVKGDDWRNLALCADGVDPEFFFPIGNPRSKAYQEDAALVYDVCLACPVLGACATATLEAERGLPASWRFGIFAAMDPAERAATEKNMRTRGRPPGGGRPRHIVCTVSAHHPRKGLAQHERRNEPPCSRCQAFLDRQAAREATEQTVDELIGRGHSDGWIAAQTGCSHETVTARRRRRTAA